MQQPPNHEYPQQQWQQQNTSWGSNPQWQQYEPLQPQYPQQMPPPQQQWQQPYYPPPYQPPEKPHNAFKLGLGIGCGIMAAFAIGIVVLAFLISAGRQSSITQQQFATQPASQPTIAPTQTIFKVGETGSNTVWSMTLNSVKTSPGDQFSTPDAGMIYLIADVTIGNLTSTSQDISTFLSFRLQNSTGQAYDETVTDIGPAPNGPIDPGGKLRGPIVYEVPKTMHDFTIQFHGNGTDGSSGTWAFTV